jgi:hypothetical protein
MRLTSRSLRLPNTFFIILLIIGLAFEAIQF